MIFDRISESLTSRNQVKVMIALIADEGFWIFGSS